MNYSAGQLAQLLPFPAADANKYTRGKALLVAGSDAYPGAACLAARACEKVGAGYTQVLCAEGVVAQVRMASPSLVVGAWEEVFVSTLCESAVQQLRRTAVNGTYSAYAEDANDTSLPPAAHAGAVAPTPLTRSGERGSVSALPLACAYLVGSGLQADSPVTERLVNMLLDNAEGPVVVDGGALGVIANERFCQALKRRAQSGRGTVLTPHAGEAQRLAAPFGFQTNDAQKLAQNLSGAYSATVVLKGPETHIFDGMNAYCMNSGSPALAKAGTGDVLAGFVVGLLAQGLGAMDACALAANLHALSAAAAAKKLTDICVCAGDVVDFLPKAIQTLKKAKERE